MPIEKDDCDIVRFAAFELNLKSGELRNDGRPVRLQPQPFRILAKLLAEPGKLVMREELQRHVWDDSTYVDFELGLNFCIRQIRTALGDDAEKPGFIETVPKRGYRFIAPVERLSPAPDLQLPAPAKENGDDQVLATATVFLGGETVESPRVAPVSQRRFILPAAGFVLVCIGSGTAWLLVQQESHSIPKILSYTQITADNTVKVPGYCCQVLANDRSRIYFSEVNNGRWGLAQVALAGGEVTAMPISLHHPNIEDISPTGTDLLVTGWERATTAALPEGPMWNAHLPGGATQRLGDLLAHDGTRSANGQKILYASGQALHVANVDGSASHELLATPGVPYRPRWSVDQKIIRFTLYQSRTGLKSLWEASSDGTNLHPLFAVQNSRDDECCGAWTADGNYYVYQSTHNGQTNIWAFRENHGSFHRGPPRPVQLTSGPISFLAPTPAVDGRHLLVVGNKTRGELMRYDRASGQFMSYLGGLSAEGLDFSRDGKWIVYASYPEARLWRCRIDGTDAKQITQDDMRVSLPRWSPDGRLIAFTGSRSGGPWKAYVVSAEGGIPEQLVPGDGPEFDAAWSPDGMSLAFAESIMSPTSGIHLVDFKTRRLSRLVDSDHLFSPRWSPDGRFLVALTNDSLNLLVFDFRTQKWRKLLQQKPVTYPTWSHDSRYITFRAIDEEGTPFYRVRVRDGSAERIASAVILGNVALSVSGAWSGLSPDNSPLLLRDTSLQEIYSLEVNWP